MAPFHDNPRDCRSSSSSSLSCSCYLLPIVMPTFSNHPWTAISLSSLSNWTLITAKKNASCELLSSCEQTRPDHVCARHWSSKLKMRRWSRWTVETLLDRHVRAKIPRFSLDMSLRYRLVTLCNIEIEILSKIHIWIQRVGVTTQGNQGSSPLE